MMHRFTTQQDAQDPVMMHDSVIFTMHQDILMKRYEDNKNTVLRHVQELLNQQPNLQGQWSIDIMQNSNEFWLIDMAPAENSAFYEESVPAQLRCPTPENWLPEIKN